MTPTQFVALCLVAFYLYILQSIFRYVYHEYRYGDKGLEMGLVFPRDQRLVRVVAVVCSVFWPAAVLRQFMRSVCARFFRWITEDIE